MRKYNAKSIEKLNNDITSRFGHLFPITDDMEKTFSGVSRLVMLDRYTQKDLSLETLSVGDLVLQSLKTIPNFLQEELGMF